MGAASNNIEMLRSALRAARMPFCAAGDIPISQDIPIKLLFRVSEQGDHTSMNSVTFPLSKADDINPLLEACKQASFGRGSEEVLDPSYRRALVLHADSFAIAPATAVDPYGLGMLAKIRQSLLSDAPGATNRGEDEVEYEDDYEEERPPQGRRIVAHLDKMNVYGVGDFFKGHVDTPRSNQMLGTLVINLPVAHEGGHLVVHAPYPSGGASGGDSGVAQSPLDGGPGQRDSYTTTWGSEDVLSWVAFFSDCPHEVLPVKRGNRVTLSYNLFFETEKDTSKLTVDAVQERAVERIVSALKLPGNLDDSQPFVAFHLQHRYPVTLDQDEAAAVKACLKGGDAVIYRALQAVQAKVTFHYVYYDDETEEDVVLAKKTHIFTEDPIEYDLREKYGQASSELGVFTALEAPLIKYKYDDEEGIEQERQPEHGEPKFPTATPFKYFAHGNDVTRHTVYASICMIASARGHNIQNKWGKNGSGYL